MGSQKFNRWLNLNMNLSEIATPSDEALGLLLLENSEVKWSFEVGTDTKDGSNEKDVDGVKTKYTSVGKYSAQKKGYTKRYGGWREDGIQRFNDILDMVKADRIKNGEWFDVVMNERWRVDSSKSKENEVPKSGELKAGNDLFDDDSDDDEEQEATIMSSSLDDLVNEYDEDGNDEYNQVQNSAEV